jgi:hypothetical protein
VLKVKKYYIEFTAKNFFGEAEGNITCELDDGILPYNENVKKEILQIASENMGKKFKKITITHYKVIE